MSKNISRKIKLVVFDWAGTTIDYGCQAPILAFIKGFRTKGIEISADIARGPMGMEKRAHIKALTEVAEVAGAWRKRYGRPVTPVDIDEMFDEFVPHLLDILKSHSVIIPGVIEAVSRLRERGVLIGSTTGYFQEAADIVAAAGAEAGYIPDSSVCASDVVYGRPSPWMIYRVMEDLNICPPEVVVSVGDTVVDVMAGLNAGVWSIGVAATGNETGLTENELMALDSHEREFKITKAQEKLKAAGAHWVIDTMDELPVLLEKINEQLADGKKP